jgi:hypothetical protein
LNNEKIPESGNKTLKFLVKAKNISLLKHLFWVRTSAGPLYDVASSCGNINLVYAI